MNFSGLGPSRRTPLGLDVLADHLQAACARAYDWQGSPEAEIVSVPEAQILLVPRSKHERHMTASLLIPTGSDLHGAVEDEGPEILARRLQRLVAGDDPDGRVRLRDDDAEVARPAPRWAGPTVFLVVTVECRQGALRTLPAMMASALMALADPLGAGLLKSRIRRRRRVDLRQVLGERRAAVR